jgi:hypothetical protein
LVAGVVIWADKKFRLGHGRAFALYIGMYTAGRAFIESLRIDEAAFIFGIRFNFLLSIVVSVLAFAYMIISARVRPGRETAAELHRSGWVRAENSSELADMAAVLGTSGENGSATATAVRTEAVPATEVVGAKEVGDVLEVADAAPPDESGTPDGKA